MILQDFKDISIGLIASRCIKLGVLPSGIIKNNNIVELLNNDLLKIYNNLTEQEKKEAIEYYKTVGFVVAILFDCNTLENSNNERVRFNLEKIRLNQKAWDIIVKN